MRPVSHATTSNAGAFANPSKKRRRRRVTRGLEVDVARAGPPSVLRQAEGALSRGVHRQVFLGDFHREFVDASPRRRVFDRDHAPGLFVAAARGEARDVENAPQRLTGHRPIEKGARRAGAA